MGALSGHLEHFCKSLIHDAPSDVAQESATKI